MINATGWMVLARAAAADVLACALGLSVACAAGVVLNSLRDEPASLVYSDSGQRFEAGVARLGAASDVAASGADPVDLAGLRTVMRGAETVLLDARPEIFHRLGHIPGAVSLPREEFEALYPRLRESLQRGNPLIVYCANPSCQDGGMVAAALRRLGHRRVLLFTGGWQAWTAAGLPEEKP